VQAQSQEFAITGTSGGAHCMNIADLQLTTAGCNLEWTAKVFLCSHR